MNGLSFFNIKDDNLKSFLHINVKSKADRHILDIRNPAVYVRMQFLSSSLLRGLIVQ